MFNDFINSIILVTGLISYGYYQNTKSHSMNDKKSNNTINNGNHNHNTTDVIEKSKPSEEIQQIMKILENNSSSNHQIFDSNNQIKRRLFPSE
ncbi:hypothetical protein DLAC_06740 [Tieghemostelium lacteum]|uniref:Uncharacterized protein n=1 Tax=Tieghemostelium lacteum TaxID=361077 RepID=A0A151ZFM4_TIELA|nr:hypothetical protein DLAC_06740 [Tieghemostelium lacteum]|eukprot:KYQ92735.1 hypothetical protein DLAC_06740 [Tieghemostelium lacteum]